MEKIAEIILAIVIVGATFAFGGVQPLAFRLMEVGVFFALLLVLVSQTRAGKIKVGLPLWPVIFALLVAIQAIPLPASVVLWLSPGRLPNDHWAASSHVGMAWAALSIYPHDTVLSLIRYLAYLSAFVLAAHFFDSRKSRSVLLATLILLGGVEASYGIAQYGLGWHRIFTYDNKYALNEATGTYINRNHYVGLLELTIPFVVAFLFANLQRWLDQSYRSARVWTSGGRNPSDTAALFYLNLAVVMGLGVVFSLSRAGILSTAVGILLIGGLVQFRARRKAWILGPALLFIGVLGYALWIGLGPVLARFEQAGGTASVDVQGRIAFWKDTLRMVRDFPLTGTGFGTFGVAFRQYQTTSIGLVVAHAHNDYLEFVSDVGLLSSGLIFLPIYWLLAKMIASFLGDPRFHRRAVTLGCIGSTLMMLIHTFVDFNLQIPANALIFSVVLGIGYKAACLEPRKVNAVPEVASEPKELQYVD